MANYNNKAFTIMDDWMTPKHAWEDIKEFIPTDKVIWEPFYGNGKSGEDIRDLGYDVIHENIDFFENDLGEIIVSNPPFDKKILSKIFKRLKIIDKPFILIMPSGKLNTNYFKECFKNEIQLIMPKPNRIAFTKMSKEKNSSPSFICYYYCYKMNLPKDIIWL
tara:strand:- start:44 stop:532 length:489 start_codon:yes stop_codon:yes gene_type:complete